MMQTQTSQTISLPSLQVTVRPLIESDLPALEWDGAYIHFRRVYAEHYHSMCHGNTLIWVAETDAKEIIGQLFLLLISQQKEVADGTKRAYLFSFRIKPEFRNQGLGTEMINLVEADLLKRGFSQIRINVARANIGAKRLYERLGYRVIGSDPGYWKYQDHLGEWRTVKEPAWRMLKNFKGWDPNVR